MLGSVVISSLYSFLIVLRFIGVLEKPIAEGVYEATYKQACYKISVVFILMKLKPQACYHSSKWGAEAIGYLVSKNADDAPRQAKDTLV